MALLGGDQSSFIQTENKYIMCKATIIGTHLGGRGTQSLYQLVSVRHLLICTCVYTQPIIHQAECFEVFEMYNLRKKFITEQIVTIVYNCF